MRYSWERHVIPAGLWKNERVFYWLIDEDLKGKKHNKHLGTLYVLDGDYKYHHNTPGMSKDEVLAVYTKMEELKLEEYFADIAPTENPEST